MNSSEYMFLIGYGMSKGFWYDKSKGCLAEYDGTIRFMGGEEKPQAGFLALIV